ncbi:MAG TPA: DUF1592 domain-containing protein [Gammaproteobacteria bacterium]
MAVRHRIALASLTVAAALAGCARDELTAHRATVSGFCLDCHNDTDRVAELSLETRDLARVADDPAIWEKVIRKLRAGMMPPADGGPRPEAAARLAFAAWLEHEIDRAAAAAPNPGPAVPLHRLNRNEYQNAIRDLLGVEVDVRELLPADDASYGFDNIAGVLKLSPTLLERYLIAADKVSRLALRQPAPFAAIDWFRVPDDLSQERRLPGLPFGTRGGMAIDYTFPVDGEYEIAADLQRDLNEGVPLYAEDQHLEISIDGERVTLFTLPGVAVAPPAQESASDPANPEINQIKVRLRASPAERASRNRADRDWRVRVPVTAGPHAVIATFIAKTAALDETPRLPFLRPYPAGVNIPETRTGAYLYSVEISGPYLGAGAEPAGSAAALSDEEAAQAATTRLADLARRAYRRSVTAVDVEPLLELYREGAAAGGFDAGMQLAVKRLLVSPEFLFRVERDTAVAAEAAPTQEVAVPTQPLDDFALASRLSFFLWSSIPDEALLATAEAGRLAEPAELESQVRRMLADPKADAFVENFAGQWLFLRNLDAIVPVQSYFPDFDDTLRQGLRRETELFFASIVREDRSALDLLRADYTYLNERVARHYGVPGIKGAHFRRVNWDADSPRRGLLGQGSLLAVTSYPDRTSPVVRGKWILENLLGTPPPNPPPNVPKLVATDGAGSALPMRERLARHRADPNCASCHALMDPLGFALENFNAIGQWRTLGDAGEPLDASGALPDGTPFQGVDGLRNALLSSDLFLTTLTEKLMTYALGRGIEYYDMPTVRAIVREASANDYRFSDLILGIVASPAFRLRGADGGASVTEAARTQAAL